MSEEMMDLNELVKSVMFTVMDGKYEISPMNDVKMKKVMSLSKTISSLSDRTGDEVAPLSDKEEDKLILCQNTILSETVSKKEGKDLKKLDKGDFEVWPMKLKNKVLELVFSQIGGAEDKDSEKN